MVSGYSSRFYPDVSIHFHYFFFFCNSRAMIGISFEGQLFFYFPQGLHSCLTPNAKNNGAPIICTIVSFDTQLNLENVSTRIFTLSFFCNFHSKYLMCAFYTNAGCLEKREVYCTRRSINIKKNLRKRERKREEGSARDTRVKGCDQREP